MSKWWWKTPCIAKTSSTVDWRGRAPGKLDSNEEKNSNPKAETLYKYVSDKILYTHCGCPWPLLVMKADFWQRRSASYFVNSCLQNCWTHNTTNRRGVHATLLYYCSLVLFLRRSLFIFPVHGYQIAFINDPPITGSEILIPLKLAVLNCDIIPP